MNFKRGMLWLLLMGLNLYSFGQQDDSTTTIQHFSGSVNATNNGISLVPSFSLGKPAVILLMSLGGQRFSVDPDIRFGLDGKPWTFLFWARYKVIPQGRLRLGTGAHLGLNFRSTPLAINGTPANNLVARRYLATEVVPNYLLAKNITVGSYFLYSRGLDDGTVKNTKFITLNSHFTHVGLGRGFYLHLNPQIFYLQQDNYNGWYTTATATLAQDKFPLSFSSTINRKIKSNIPGSKDFIWNVSVAYSFNRNYVPRPAAL